MGGTLWLRGLVGPFPAAWAVAAEDPPCSGWAGKKTQGREHTHKTLKRANSCFNLQINNTPPKGSDAEKSMMEVHTLRPKTFCVTT